MNKLISIISHKRYNQSGQILVVLLLIMIVGLTVGVMLMSRTTVDISTTTLISDSSRAFNAAEAGIEEAIRNIQSIVEGSPVPVSGDANYIVDYENLGDTAGMYPDTIPVADAIQHGDVFTVWFVRHDQYGGLIFDTPRYTGDTISICFDKSGANDPAIAITAFYLNSISDTAARSTFAGFDPAGRANNFSGVSGIGSCQSGDYTYDWRVNLNFASDFGINLSNGTGRIVLGLRIRPVYDQAAIAVLPVTGATLPIQGNLINALGEAGETSRKIQVEEPFPLQVPWLDYAVYQTGPGELGN